MKDQSEAYNLLLLIGEVSQHGTMYPAIRETAARRLKELEDETAKELADAKKTESAKALSEQSRLAQARQAEIDKANAPPEAAPELIPGVYTEPEVSPVPPSDEPILERRL